MTMGSIEVEKLPASTRLLACHVSILDTDYLVDMGEIRPFHSRR